MKAAGHPVRHQAAAVRPSGWMTAPVPDCPAIVATLAGAGPCYNCGQPAALAVRWPDGPDDCLCARCWTVAVCRLAAAALAAARPPAAWDNGPAADDPAFTEFESEHAGD